MDTELETFYVYRSLNSDDSWGAVLGCSHITQLPNSDFVIKAVARNEKEAISKGKEAYDKIHKHDTNKENIMKLVCATFGSVFEYSMKQYKTSKDVIVKEVLDYSVKLNEGISNYCNALNEMENKDERS